METSDEKSLRSSVTSTSSSTSSKSKDLFRFFEYRLVRKSKETIYNSEDDSCNTSSDSCSSSSGHLQNVQGEMHSSSYELSHGSSLSGDDDDDINNVIGNRGFCRRLRKHYNFTTNSQLNIRKSLSPVRRVLSTLVISPRSLSCSNSPTNDIKHSNKKTKIKKPQRILRQPIVYTYVKGLSGLPTQRVPRSDVYCRCVNG